MGGLAVRAGGADEGSGGGADEGSGGGDAGRGAECLRTPHNEETFDDDDEEDDTADDDEDDGAGLGRWDSVGDSMARNT